MTSAVGLKFLKSKQEVLDRWSKLPDWKPATNRLLLLMSQYVRRLQQASFQSIYACITSLFTVYTPSHNVLIITSLSLAAAPCVVFIKHELTRTMAFECFYHIYMICSLSDRYIFPRVILYNIILFLLIYGGSGLWGLGLILGFWGWGFQLIGFGACGVGPSGFFGLGLSI